MESTMTPTSHSNATPKRLAASLGIGRRVAPIAILLAATMSGGCDVFDASVYLAAEGGAGGVGGGNSEGGDGLELSDNCEVGVTPVLEGAEDLRSDLDNYVDNHNTLDNCGVTGAVGPDGFFAIKSNAGQRWHFEVEPENPDTDITLYLLSGCSTETCMISADRCSAGVPEELTLMIKEAGDYFLGVDSYGNGGGVAVTLVNPTCGNNELEHGETCDDGNLQSNDGCDSACRVELTAGTFPEVEPNNWHAEANTLDLTATNDIGVVTIAGTVGGKCDQDHFQMHVPEGGGLRVAMFDGAGFPCMTPPQSMIMVMNPALGVQMGMGMPGGEGGECPAIMPMAPFANDMPEGDYHVMLLSQRDAPSFDYQLRIEVLAPSPAQ